MVSDKDFVLLEGTVVGTPYKSVSGEKVALNFTLESMRDNGYGKKTYNHQVVIWNKMVEDFGEKITNGAYVSGRGHLQVQKLAYKDVETGEVKTLEYDKCCFDYIEIE